MKIVQIISGNLHYLHTFCGNIMPPQFRYFNTRKPADAVSNHVITLIGLINDTPIAYGHIDYDSVSKRNWLGVCVLPEYQGCGYGKTIVGALIRRADTLAIPTLHLSVDITNTIAQALYKSVGFVHDSDSPRFMTRCAPSRTENSIKLPVSYGEALDKLSILDIKLAKITDTRRADVQREYDAIYNELLPLFTHDVQFHYNTLKDINLSIWEMQDIFRESCDNAEKNRLCNTIIIDNDRRFRVKHKINAVLNSALKEQKGYARRKVCFLGHTELGDTINGIGIVRYLATLYDEVRIPVRENYMNNVKLLYADDPSITFYPISKDICIYRSRGYKPDLLAQITDGYEVVAAGINRICYGKIPSSYDTLPFNFYVDAGLSIDVFWKYSHYAHCPESKPLADKLAGIPYIFIQANSGNGPCFRTEQVEAYFDIDRATTLIIDADKNNYQPDHPWHALAEQFVYKPVAYYRETIMNADRVIVCDSSLMCYSIQLPIKATECYYVTRKAGFVQHYDYIFTEPFCFDPSTGRRQFRRLPF
jgi:GNAT superfamily N-acetyltransferase